MKALLVLTATLAPALALACPSCARDASPLAGLFIAGMIGAPYAIGYLAVRAIRDSDQAPSPGAEP
jgi:predicted Kef-type K+ transport protein